MKAPRARLSAAIADTTLKDGVSKKYAEEVAAYLLTERRVGDLESIMRDVQSDWADKGYVEVLASSAHPLSDNVKQEITQQFAALYPAAKTIVITDIIDPEVVGGVRLNLADRQLDLSIEAKLNKFKQLTSAGKE